MCDIIHFWQVVKNLHGVLDLKRKFNDPMKSSPNPQRTGYFYPTSVIVRVLLNLWMRKKLNRYTQDMKVTASTLVAGMLHFFRCNCYRLTIYTVKDGNILEMQRWFYDNYLEHIYPSFWKLARRISRRMSGNWYTRTEELISIQSGIECQHMRLRMRID